MKSRVLLIMLIILIVLSAMMMACGTIFVVRDITIVDETVQSVTPLSEMEKQDIIEKCGLQGKNILFNLNQEKIAEKLKAYNPMLKLHSVKAEFPSGVILCVARRSAVYTLKKDAKTFYLDAEMCVVENLSNSACIDITGANLVLSNEAMNIGDHIVGKTNKDKHKIEQLKTIVNYFDSLNGFEISYDDSVQYTYFTILKLKIKDDVTFKIIIDIYKDEDFLKALDYTNQYYGHENKKAGEYKTQYRGNNPETVIGGE